MHKQFSHEVLQQIKYQLDLGLRNELDIELSDFKLESLAEICITSLAPIIYNNAIKDAHAYLAEKLIDMESDLYAEERK